MRPLPLRVIGNSFLVSRYVQATVCDTSQYTLWMTLLDFTIALNIGSYLPTYLPTNLMLFVRYDSFVRVVLIDELKYR